MSILNLKLKGFDELDAALEEVLKKSRELKASVNTLDKVLLDMEIETEITKEIDKERNSK